MDNQHQTGEPKGLLPRSWRACCIIFVILECLTTRPNFFPGTLSLLWFNNDQYTTWEPQHTRARQSLTCRVRRMIRLWIQYYIFKLVYQRNHQATLSFGWSINSMQVSCQSSVTQCGGLECEGHHVMHKYGFRTIWSHFERKSYAYSLKLTYSWWPDSIFNNSSSNVCNQVGEAIKI